MATVYVDVTDDYYLCQEMTCPPVHAIYKPYKGLQDLRYREGLPRYRGAFMNTQHVQNLRPDFFHNRLHKLQLRGPGLLQIFQKA